MRFSAVLLMGSAVMFLGYAVSSEAEGSTLTGEKVVLWPDGAPGAIGEGEGHTPTLHMYLPPKATATGAAIVVCPGGGYANLAVGHEGEDIAQWLLSEGIAAGVLCYRHAPNYRHPIPLTDAKRALRTVRARAAEWGVDPARIGMLGFSAGGHLTATAGTQFDAGDPQAADPIDRLSSRPDFLVLIYPVISTTESYTHAGSRQNLLGPSPDPALVQKLSAEKQVTGETPPTFLVATSGDKGVPAENSVAFYLALRKAGVPGELHIFEKGPHGFGLAPEDPVLSTWPRHCIAWLRERGILK